MNIYVKAFMDKNFGDDMMIIRLLSSCPNAKFYIHCNKKLHQFYNELFKDFDNYILTEIELKKIYKFGLRFFKFVILIGGSTLQGSRNKGCYYRFLNILSLCLAKAFNTQYCIMGCNTGPFINKFTELFVKLELKCASLITTRDTASYDFIRKVNRKAKIYFYPDMLFNIGEDYNIKKCSNKNQLGICVFNSTKEQLANQDKNDFFAGVIDEYINRTGGQVSIFAFDVGNQNDLQIANQIYELIKNKSDVSVVAHSTEYLSIIYDIAKCEKLVAVRFHAAIVALSLQIPVLPIIYSNKMSNLLDDLKYHSDYISLNDIENSEVSSFVDKIIGNKNNLYATRDQIKDANKHLEILKKYISKSEEEYE